MQFKLFFTISLLFLGLAVSERTLITFKSGACERLGHEYHQGIFSESSDAPKFFKNVGVLSVETDIYKLHEKVSVKSEFHECIQSIEKDFEIKITDPVVMQDQVNEDRKQWQLKRINVHQLPLPETFNRFEVTDVPSHTYIIDSGVDGNHQDFVGRLAPNDEHKAFVSDTCACRNDGPLCDCNGHGTHCAGLVGSPVAGYNLHTTIHAAKVFNYSGSTTMNTVIEAMDWVLQHHTANHADQLAVVSMSLGGPRSTAQNQAAQRLKEGGLLLVVAAGNENQDARNVSPASSEYALTVGASDIDDSRAYFSNYGTSVDIFAPGVQIYSSKPGNTYQYLSGTSMATPFVAGFASFVGTYLRTTNPDEIIKAINGHASEHVVTNAKSDNNNLPYDNLAQAREQIELAMKSLKFLRGKK